MPWTDNKTAKLAKLWASPVSASKIAAQLGVTKNAVIGKAHRLELPPRRRGRAPTKRTLRP